MLKHDWTWRDIMLSEINHKRINTIWFHLCEVPCSSQIPEDRKKNGGYQGWGERDWGISVLSIMFSWKYSGDVNVLNGMPFFFLTTNNIQGGRVAWHGRGNITCLTLYWWTVLFFSLGEARFYKGRHSGGNSKGLVCLFMNCGFSWLLTGSLWQGLKSVL